MKKPKINHHSIDVIERRYYWIKYNHVPNNVHTIKVTHFELVSVPDYIEQCIRRVSNSLPKGQFIKGFGVNDRMLYVDICVGVRNIAIPDNLK